MCLSLSRLVRCYFVIIMQLAASQIDFVVPRPASLNPGDYLDRELKKTVFRLKNVLKVLWVQFGTILKIYWCVTWILLLMERVWRPTVSVGSFIHENSSLVKERFFL